MATELEFRPDGGLPPPVASTSGQDHQVLSIARLLNLQRRLNMAELIQLGGGYAAKEQLDMLQARLQHGARLLQPTICKARSETIREVEFLQHELGISVPDWQSLKSTSKPRIGAASHAAPRGGVPRVKPVAQSHQGPGKMGTAVKMLRAVKSKANGSGRTYTSKYRGVHQTFPTKRWEAQFRRNGKPTSLGCFDHEEEAARAYDKMMLWCELHNASGVKSGITNFDATEYEKEFPWLQAITQDELIEALRSEGRRQAAHRMMRQKREGQAEAATEDFDDPQPSAGPAATAAGAGGRQPTPPLQRDGATSAAAAVVAVGAMVGGAPGLGQAAGGVAGLDAATSLLVSDEFLMDG